MNVKCTKSGKSLPCVCRMKVSNRFSNSLQYSNYCLHSFLRRNNVSIDAVKSQWKYILCVSFKYIHTEKSNWGLFYPHED